MGKQLLKLTVFVIENTCPTTSLGCIEKAGNKPVYIYILTTTTRSQFSPLFSYFSKKNNFYFF